MDYLIAYSQWLGDGCTLRYMGTDTCVVEADSQSKAIELFRKQYSFTYYKIIAITKLEGDTNIQYDSN